MKTKVKSVQANGTYQSKFGLLYKFDYEFEDGKSLSANHKTQEGNFKPGDEVEYEIKGSNDYGSWGSVSKPKEEFKKNDDVEIYIIRQSSLTRAIEHLSYKDHDKMTKENVTALADYYTDYVLNGLKNEQRIR